MGYRRLEIDGGSVEYVVSGPEDAPDLLLFHVGTPSAAVVYPGLTKAAADAGMRVATYSRAGYGRSTRREGRSVADEAAISAAIADRLGHGRLFTLGWSGGGPVALACAALLEDRVKACVTLASISPRVEAGAAWASFHTPEQLQEWTDLAAGDLAALLPEFEEAASGMARITPLRLHSIGGPPDARAVAHDAASEIDPALVKSMRRAVVQGYAGFLDDNLAQARDWGFRVADIRIPVVVRQGALDRLVPEAHGRWLAAAIPGARGVFLEDAGHGSIALPWPAVIEDLVGAAAFAGVDPGPPNV